MTPHGDYIKELELYVNELGIDPLDVIRWATIHGAECMGAGEARGGIVEGELADLIVVKGDPAKNISVLGETRNLLAIMKDGQFIKAPTETSARWRP